MRLLLTKKYGITDVYENSSVLEIKVKKLVLRLLVKLCLTKNLHQILCLS